MSAATQRWEKIYDTVPLAAVPSHFAAMSGSPFMIQYPSRAYAASLRAELRGKTASVRAMPPAITLH